MLALISLNVIVKTGVGGDEHRLLLLAYIKDEGIIFAPFAEAAFDGRSRTSRQIRFQRIAQVFVEDERLLFLLITGMNQG